MKSALTLASLSGWRRLAVAAASGAVAALALPPLYLAPVLVLSFTALVWLLAGADRRRSAFAIGWWFGFGYFVISLYWVGFALFVEADKYAWLLPFSALGLPALLSLFSGCATLLTTLLVGRPGVGEDGISRIFVLALCWSLLEWLRSFVLTGFPWNLPGYAWGASDALMQFASVVGVHGLGLLTIVFAASPAALACDTPGARRWTLPVLSVAALVAISIWGQARLVQNPTTFVEGANLRLVQPAIDQKDKWRPELRRSFLDRYLQMSSEAGVSGVSILVWPETAIPYFLNQNPAVRRTISEVLSPNGILLTGVPRTHAGSRIPGSSFEVWNSVQALDSRGEIVASYDKHHLVPFGEYVPLRRILGVLGIERLAAGRGDFQRGPGPRTLALPGYPGVGPLICYEAIFPGHVVSGTNRPGWMLNVTNDAWFGTSAGPHQHFAIARMRAVEEGLPLVRAANSGISGVIDPLGRVTGRLELGTSGVLDRPLPTALATPTLYARFGNTGFLVLMLLVAGLTLVSRLFRASKATRP